MRLLCEVAGEPDGLTATLAERVRAATGLRAEVDLVPPGSLPNDGRVIEDRRADAIKQLSFSVFGISCFRNWRRVMSEALAYPATRYHPAPVVDLSDPAERERLSPAAIRTFLNILETWRVRDEDARQLLGGMSNGAFYAMKKDPDRVLDEDRLRRIS